MKSLAVTLLCLALPAGCFKPSAHRPPVADAACPLPLVGPEATWRNRFGSALVAKMSPHHAANDPVINPGQEAVVEGKFAYGPISKDLQDEEVELWFQDGACGDWQKVGAGITDSDGRVRIEVPGRLIARAGAYPYQLIVRGDRSRARGTVYVVEPGAEVVIFDIDGTLTTDDGEILEQMATGADPEMYPGAPEVVRRYVDAGYLPIYITGRPYALRAGTRGWLERNDFPPGPMVTTDRALDGLPGESRVGAFKSAILGWLIDRVGLRIPFAYGNATTDVCAYARAGVEPAATFIIGPHAGKACDGFAPTQPVHDYREHLRGLEVTPASSS